MYIVQLFFLSYFMPISLFNKVGRHRGSVKTLRSPLCIRMRHISSGVRELNAALCLAKRINENNLFESRSNPRLS